MKLLKILSFLPACCMMALIFYFSSHTAADSSQVSISLTQTILEMICDLFHLNWEPALLMQYAASAEHFIRKLAHFSEYFLLAASFSFPLHVHRIRSKKQILLSVLFCALFAVLDEWHQTFVPGRSGAVKDCILDTFGSLCGAVTFYFVVTIRHS